MVFYSNLRMVYCSRNVHGQTWFIPGVSRTPATLQLTSKLSILFITARIPRNSALPGLLASLDVSQGT